MIRLLKKLFSRQSKQTVTAEQLVNETLSKLDNAQDFALSLLNK